jgi:dihydrofolate reductase
LKTALVLVAAVARNGVIGDGQRMPWQIPEDARHFREVTAGWPVIMGRRTWESLPARFRPLPGRHNIVVTGQPGWQAAGATRAASLDQALAAAAGAERACVIGGAGLYAAALPLADELLLTEIDRDFEGEVRFPSFDRRAFVEVDRRTVAAAAPNEFMLAFVTYRAVARQPA